MSGCDVLYLIYFFHPTTIPMKMTLISMIMAAVMFSCGHGSNEGSDTTGDTAQATPTVAAFNGDSALMLAREQCNFGPRVPGTPAHARCAEWLTATLRASCDSVMVQTGTVTTGQGKSLDIKNIVGIINPQADRRILLLAHWDTRPWADKDPDPAKHDQPVMGANDGASGVAVLLQLARQLKASGTTLGIDILLVDAEDMGIEDKEESWALGAQYWAATPHIAGYKPLFGILLDMVGAPDAVFSREYYSLYYASGIVDEVWKHAAGSHFTNADGGAVTDDHVFINQASIPCIDIIDMRADSETGFYDAWHTTGDTIDRLSAKTLGEVGQTLLNVIADMEE